MASAQNESDEEHDSQDLRIVLLGVSGAGKSAIGNAILGRDLFKESRTRESEIQGGRVEDRNISIIDTPGFFNAHLTDEELKKQMMKGLYLAHPGPHVFLLFVNLETFREEQRDIVEQIQVNFGEEALKFTMVLFIGREKVSRRVLNQIIESQETKKILNYFEGRFHVINSKNECDSSQIIKLLKSIDEMVKNNGEQHYSNEIYLKKQRKIREQERMKQGENRIKQEEARMKQEQVWNSPMEMKTLRDDCDTSKQTGGINQEEEIKMRSKEKGIKDDSYRKIENVNKTPNLRENEAAVRDNLRKQIESRREKERQRWKLEKEITQEDQSRAADLTATANTILGRDVFRADAVAGTLTSEKQESVVSGRPVSVIDTPELLDELHDHLFSLTMLSEMALRSSLIYSNLSKQDLRIVLLGELGAGKSSTGNTILGKKVFQASPMLSTESCEREIAVVFGRMVSVIDTPGLLLFFIQQSEIEKSVEMSAPGPHVFLLVINLLRVSEERMNTVKLFQENLETDALNHTIVLFTHADWMNLVIDEPLNEYIEKHNALKSLIDSCGGRYHSLDNEDVQDRFQVLQLLMKIDAMLEKNGGTHYTKPNIFKRAQRDTKQDGCEIL